MFEALPNTPQSLGDIVGRSFRMFRNQIRPIVSIFIWPSFISTVCVAGLRLCLGHWLSLHTLAINTSILHAGIALVLMAVLAVAQWQMSICGLALLRCALGLDVNYNDSYTTAQKRKWPALLLYIMAVVLPTALLVFWLGAVAAFILLTRATPTLSYLSSLVFSLAGFLLTVTVSWCLLFMFVAFSVLACEDLGLSKVFSRSAALTMRYLWRGGSFIVLLMTCLAALLLAIDLPLIIANVADVSSHGLSAERLTNETPAYIQLLGCACDTVANVILIGVAVIADALYYHDLRMRLEGQDILSALAQMSG